LFGWASDWPEGHDWQEFNSAGFDRRVDREGFDRCGVNQQGKEAGDELGALELAAKFRGLTGSVPARGYDIRGVTESASNSGRAPERRQVTNLQKRAMLFLRHLPTDAGRPRA
jgi:hypothetical protein